MLVAPHRPTKTVTEASIGNGEIVFGSEYCKTRLLRYENDILRVTVTRREGFSKSVSPYLLDREPIGGLSLYDGAAFYRAGHDDTEVVLSKENGAVSVYKNGSLLFRQGGAATLEEFTARMIDRSTVGQTEQIATADGVKTLVREASRLDYKKLYRVMLPLAFSEGEALFGLGQIDERGGNLRRRKLYMCHSNRQIALPIYVSNKGYGVLFNCACPFVFDDSSDISSIYLEAVDELDYYIIPGKPEEVVRKYHYLTGLPSLLPAWAFGYVQSQERYETQEEILGIASSYRENGIGLDCIVLDWCSWPDKQWGQKSFDQSRFPDPKLMTDKLRAMDVHFMLSIWPNMNRHAPDNQEFRDKGWLLPGGEHYDAFDPNARRLYWCQAKEGLFTKGVDAWWCDSSEPWTSEWEHKEMPMWEDTYHDTFKTASDALGADNAMGYAFHHATTVYEGQRSETNEKRVLNLTRSAWTGQQRLGTVMWSGDIFASWNILRNQISQGTGFSASGMPYWTDDIGGFFVKKGEAWYWDGEFEKGMEDPEYRELFIRWYQFAAFLPMFRGHGTDIRRELTQFAGEEREAILKYNRLRYRLMPYIYTLAGKCALFGGMMTKPLAFDYPDDENAISAEDQFMLGDSIIICPVTHYKEKSIRVYLPKGNWYGLETKALYKGGEYHDIPCGLNSIPVFIKQGSVLPVSHGGRSVSEALSGCIRMIVFEGCNGEGCYYTDALDGYAYEKGGYTLKRYTWDEQSKTLIDENGTVTAYTLFTDDDGGLYR